MQNDIVELFEKYSNEIGWRFSYGNKANQNLLQSNFKENEIYFILDPVTRLRAFGQFGGTGVRTYTGSFLLVVKSTIDQVYHNQTDEDTFVNRIETLDGGEVIESSCDVPANKPGKYVENIKPLLNTELPKIESLINCSDYQINGWNIVDVIDVFDANTDGIIVTFNITIL